MAQRLGHGENLTRASGRLVGVGCGARGPAIAGEAPDPTASPEENPVDSL
jgi:hypothetical protein